MIFGNFLICSKMFPGYPKCSPAPPVVPACFLRSELCVYKALCQNMFQSIFSFVFFKNCFQECLYRVSRCPRTSRRWSATPPATTARRTGGTTGASSTIGGCPYSLLLKLKIKPALEIPLLSIGVLVVQLVLPSFILCLANARIYR